MPLQVFDRGEGWTLYQGESVSGIETFESAQFDALVTDPPYSSGGFTRSDRSSSPAQKYTRSDSMSPLLLPDYSGDNRDQLTMMWWMDRWMTTALDKVKRGGTMVVWTDWRQIVTTITAVQMAGWVYRGLCPWVKPGARPQPGRFGAAAEFIVWGSHGSLGEGNGSYPQGYTKAEQYFEAQPAVEALYVRGSDREHITQKPVPVMRWCLGMLPKGGMVLDPFAGSGSTGVACADLGLVFVGIEREEAYCRIAARRLRDAYAQTRIR